MSGFGDILGEIVGALAATTNEVTKAADDLVERGGLGNSFLGGITKTLHGVTEAALVSGDDSQSKTAAQGRSFTDVVAAFLSGSPEPSTTQTAEENPKLGRSADYYKNAAMEVASNDPNFADFNSIQVPSVGMSQALIAAKGAAANIMSA